MAACRRRHGARGVNNMAASRGARHRQQANYRQNNVGGMADGGVRDGAALAPTTCRRRRRGALWSDRVAAATSWRAIDMAYQHQNNGGYDVGNVGIVS